MTSWASGVIVGAIPDGTTDREIGLIWGIPDLIWEVPVRFLLRTAHLTCSYLRGWLSHMKTSWHVLLNVVIVFSIVLAA